MAAYSAPPSCALLSSFTVTLFQILTLTSRYDAVESRHTGWRCSVTQAKLLAASEAHRLEVRDGDSAPISATSSLRGRAQEFSVQVRLSPER
jgi:hypothetical protein